MNMVKAASFRAARYRHPAAVDGMEVGMSYTCLDVARAAQLLPGPIRGAEHSFHCPGLSHTGGDKHPSLLINVTKNCFMCGPCGIGGTAWQLAAFLAGVNPSDKPYVIRWLTEHGVELDKTSRNAIKSSHRHEEHRRVVAAFDYTDDSGQLLYQVQRWEPGKDGRRKDFTVRRPDGSGGWVDGIGDTRRVLYRLPELLKADTVYIVEGEGKVEDLRKLGLTGTCCPFGVDGWRAEYAEFFSPWQKVIVLGDKDEAGRRYIAKVGTDVVTRVASVKVIAEMPGVPSKGDVCDWLAAGGTREQLEALVAAAPEFVPTTSEGAADDPQPVLIRLSDVKPEETDWIWPGRIAKGKLSLFIGDPGQGKSTALIDVAARNTRGAEWPDGGRADVGNVIILTAEDGLADTVRPRVDMQGGDAARVYVLKAIRQADDERPFSLTSDLPHLEAAIKSVGDVRLIIIDPLSAYLGDKNSYKDSEIRTLLTPLAALAERCRVAIVGILHLTKDAQRKALYRAQGTIAFVAAARTVFAVGRDSDNPDRRIFVCVKNNLAVHPPALAFSIVDQAGRGRLEWEKEPVNGVDADSILSMSITEDEREDRNNVERFLRQLLRDVPVASMEVYEAARQNGFSQSTVNRAKARLDIDAVKTGQPGEKGQKWYWVLPKIVAKDVNTQNVTTFEQTEHSKADDSICSPKIVTKVGVTTFGDNLRADREEFDV